MEHGIFDIINYIIKIIPEAENDTRVDEVKLYSVPSFKGEVELEFRKPSGKLTHTLSYYGLSSKSIFRTQKEYYKFGDKICEKLGQMRSGEINILGSVDISAG